MSGSDWKVIAYYYPGWHRSQWKALDEWLLLDVEDPLFTGHNTLQHPERGEYDDRDRNVVSEQIHEASRFGVNSFMYFLYFGPRGYVLDTPTRVALELAQEKCFEVGVTWCLRLPHQYFPIPVDDDMAPLAQPEHRKGPNTGDLNTLVADLVPAALFDTCVETFIKLASPDRSFQRARRGGTVTDVLGESHRKDEVPENQSADEIGHPTLGQLVDFLTAVKNLPGQRAMADLTMDALEHQLALSGLLDISLFSVSVLINETEPGPANVLKGLTASIVVEAFAGPEAYFEPKDIIFLASLGQTCRDTLNVFEGVRLAELTRGLTPSALQAMSARYLRRVIEGIACNSTQSEDS